MQTRGVQNPKNLAGILYELPPFFMKFHDRILPEAFRKLLASHATQRWGQEIQEGVYDMLEIFIDLVVTRLNAEEKLSKEGDAKAAVEVVPHLMLRILASAFDLKTDWNVKNRHRSTRTRGNRWDNPFISTNIKVA